MPAGTHIERSVIGKRRHHPPSDPHLQLRDHAGRHRRPPRTDLDSVVMDGEHSVYCPGVAAQRGALQSSMTAVAARARRPGAPASSDRISRARCSPSGRRVTVLDNLSVGRREAVPGRRALRARRRPRRGGGRRRAGRRRLRLPPGRAGHHSRQLRSLLRGPRHQRDGHGAAAPRGRSATQVKWFTLASSMAVLRGCRLAGADRRVASRRGRSRRTASASWRPRTCRSQMLEARGIPFTARALLQHLRPRPDLHAVCRRASRSSSRACCAARRPSSSATASSSATSCTWTTSSPARWRRRAARRDATTSAPGRGTSLNQLAAMVLAKLAPGQKATHADAPAGELRFSVADISAARRALGYSPTRSLRAGSR